MSYPIIKGEKPMIRNIIVMPDSFKGSMSSETVADIITKEAEKEGLSVKKFPIADGGEGSVDCILNVLGGRKINLTVYGPDGELKQAAYGVTADGTAVLEIAESSGITKQKKLNPLTSDTYGFGQMIEDALSKGYRKFLLCLGGSATTDCGLGMAAALGVKFTDFSGKEIVPSGGRLSQVKQIDIKNINPLIKQSAFTVMSDVENPLFGRNGAAFVFSPQKGASDSEVELLDEGLRSVAPIIRNVTGVDFESLKGAGAAGGAGYGCAAFLKAKITSGIHAMLDLCRFDENVKDADLIVTGEGKLDSQSLMGKVLSGIKTRAGDTPIVSFCGISEADSNLLKRYNVTAVEIGRNIPLEQSIKDGRRYLRDACRLFFENIGNWEENK